MGAYKADDPFLHTRKICKGLGRADDGAAISDGMQSHGSGGCNKRNVGRNGKGRLSILCSSTSTNSSFYNINDEKLSYDFYSYAVTRGLGWDMLSDCAIGSMAADANGDGKVTVSELASYSRGATQRGISAFIQQYGKDDFSGHAAQFPAWQIASGDEDLVIFQR